MKNNRHVTGCNPHKNRDKEKREILVQIKLEKNIVKRQLEIFLRGAFKISASPEQNIKEGPELPVPSAFYF